MEPYEIDGVKLRKLKAVILQELTSELVDVMINEPKVEASTQASTALAGVMVRAVFEMLGDEMDRVECRWPADWWQAFKQRWFPAWALRRWPVREEVRHLVARELYPKVKLPDREPIVALEIR